MCCIAQERIKLNIFLYLKSTFIYVYDYYMYIILPAGVNTYKLIVILDINVHACHITIN